MPQSDEAFIEAVNRRTFTPEPDVNPKELRVASDAKDPLDYLEPLVNPSVARVMRHGAEKYGFRNYTVTPCKIRTYIGAVQRHLDAIKLGEDIDPDSGESHWAHIIAGTSCWMGAEMSGMGVDDREAVSTPRSDAVHRDGNLDAKGGGAWEATVEPGHAAGEARACAGPCAMDASCGPCIAGDRR